MKKPANILSLLLVSGFILGSCKGYLALWDEDRPDPIQIFPCPVKTLPAEDQEVLEQGIHARSRMELDSLLEDYLS